MVDGTKDDIDILGGVANTLYRLVGNLGNRAPDTSNYSYLGWGFGTPSSSSIYLNFASLRDLGWIAKRVRFSHHAKMMTCEL